MCIFQNKFVLHDVRRVLYHLFRCDFDTNYESRGKLKEISLRIFDIVTVAG
jgi:hypothetical protein